MAKKQNKTSHTNIIIKINLSIIVAFFVSFIGVKDFTAVELEINSIFLLVFVISYLFIDKIIEMYYKIREKLVNTKLKDLELKPLNMFLAIISLLCLIFNISLVLFVSKLDKVPITNPGLYDSLTGTGSLFFPFFWDLILISIVIGIILIPIIQTFISSDKKTKLTKLLMGNVLSILSLSFILFLLISLFTKILGAL